MIQKKLLVWVLELLVEGHVNECHHHRVRDLVDVLGRVKESLFQCLGFLEGHLRYLTLREIVIWHLDSSPIKIHADHLRFQVDHDVFELSTGRHAH